MSEPWQGFETIDKPPADPRDFCQECGMPLTQQEKNGFVVKAGRAGRCQLCSELTSFETLLLRHLREIDTSLLTIRDVLENNLPTAGQGI
jgi:hypothetical protein